MGFGGFCPVSIRLGGDNESGWTAAQHARVCADMVANKRTLPVAWVTFSHASTAITIEAFGFMPGSSTSFRPTATHVSTGRSSWAFVACQSDEYGVAQQLVVRHVIAGAHYTGTCRKVTIGTIGSSSFACTLRTAVGTPCDGRATVVLW